MRLAAVPIHPFFFALLPVIATINWIKFCILPKDIVPTIVLLQALEALLFLMLWVFLRSIYQAGVVSSLFTAIIFLYRIIAIFINTFIALLTGHFPQAWLTLLCFFILAAAVITPFITGKFGKKHLPLDYISLTKSLNFVSLILIVINVSSLVVYKNNAESVFLNVNSQLEAQAHADNLKLDNSSTKPDIYYIMVDGFANWRTVRDLTGCKQFPLYQFLRENNFYVVDRATSNYDYTIWSLPSCLHMQYFDSIRETLRKSFPNDVPYFPMNRVLLDNRVVHLLRQLGYKFYNISSGSCPTDFIPQADENFGCMFPFFPNHFTVLVALFTPLYSLEKYWPLCRDLEVSFRLRPDLYLPKVISLPSPKFVLLHSELVHAPILFDRNGKRLALPLAITKPFWYINWGNPSSLTSQYIFAQGKIISWLRLILDQSKSQPIIVINSDHGPMFPDSSIKQFYNMRLRILNAYYFPGQNHKGLYPSITPVNSFRVLFNDYFHANLPILPDHSYGPSCYPDCYDKPYDWREVTKELDF